MHEESEQSDDELLSLSSQHSNASGDKPHGTPKHSKKQQEPPAAPPPEDVDLLGLDGSPMSKSFPSQPSAAPSNSDLLNDLFGVGGPSSQSPGGAAADEVFHVGGAGSVQSTPRRSAASASPSPSPRVGEGNGGLAYRGAWVWRIPLGDLLLAAPISCGGSQPAPLLKAGASSPNQTLLEHTQGFGGSSHRQPLEILSFVLVLCPIMHVRRLLKNHRRVWVGPEHFELNLSFNLAGLEL